MSFSWSYVHVNTRPKKGHTLTQTQLLRNLQNAASTFGEGSPAYESVRSTVEEHLRDMKRQNKPTNITKARKLQSQEIQQHANDDIELPAMFENLAIRSKSDS